MQQTTKDALTALSEYIGNDLFWTAWTPFRMEKR